MKKHKGMWILVILPLLVSLFAGPLSETAVAAEKDFPKKEITFLINYAAGGGRDTLARGVGKTMSKHLGVPMVVMNVPGAGGARGFTQLYRSAPDGYTISVGAGTEIVAQIVEKQDYDVTKLTYFGRIQHAPQYLFVKSDSPFRSLKDLKKFGKPVRCGCFSLTSFSSVQPMVIAKREDFPLTIVGAYQSNAATILALVRGEIEVTGSQLNSALAYVKTGQIRPIVTFDQKRSPEFPDVPTAGEQGHKDLDATAIDSWVMGPPGVPKPQSKILEDALMKTLREPEFVAWAKGAGIDVDPLSGEATAKLVLDLFELMRPYKAEIEKHMK